MTPCVAYFVHYATAINGKLKRLSAGPYTMDEAIVKKRELEASRGIIAVHIEEEVKTCSTE